VIAYDAMLWCARGVGETSTGSAASTTKSLMPVSRWVTSVLLAVAIGCGGSTPPDASVSAPPRAMRIDENEIVIEGRWSPVEEAVASAVAPNSVRVVCTRSLQRCREELTTSPSGQKTVTETLDYRVREWTKAKLVAGRRSGVAEMELRISLTGSAAQKVVIDNKEGRATATHWRLE
jgi:hypothetical protein